MASDPHKLLLQSGCDQPVALVAVRGYSSPPGQNALDSYDDRIFLLAPDFEQEFQANTDPSKLFKGEATLKPGLYLYKVGVHGLSRPAARRYPALVQAAPVTVIRQGGGEDRGYFGLNIHRGGYKTTGSEGCQTIHPDQWDAFLRAVLDQLNKYDQTVIPYLLVENTA
jgi:hypothetical protein